MLLSLITAAFADGPTVSATVDTETIGGRKNVDAALHVGFDMRGLSPGIGAKFDLGQRVSVDGVVFAGAPTAERLKWTGGASLGLEFSPIKVQLGTHGSFDFDIGVGGMMTGNGVAKLDGGPFDFAEWAAGTIQISPNGTWSVYGGVLASDLVRGNANVQPRAGVTVKLD